jgi:hypothetical protein
MPKEKIPARAFTNLFTRGAFQINTERAAGEGAHCDLFDHGRYSSMSVSETDLRAGRINDQLETELNALGSLPLKPESGGLISFANQWRQEISKQVQDRPWAAACGALLIGCLLGVYSRRG